MRRSSANIGAMPKVHLHHGDPRGFPGHPAAPGALTYVPSAKEGALPSPEKRSPLLCQHLTIESTEASAGSPPLFTLFLDPLLEGLEG